MVRDYLRGIASGSQLSKRNKADVVDKLKMMETFVKIASAGSLVKAAKQLEISPALATKHLKDLETYLGTRLLNRTTRQIALTEIGQEYYHFCIDSLAQIEEEERYILQRQSTARGNIKISSPMGFGNLKLAPTISEFLDKYPEVKVSLMLSDVTPTPAYLNEEGFDLAVVFGELEESNMIARKLGEVRWAVCATPGYLAQCGRPQNPQDLATHNCLVHRKVAPSSTWRFKQAEQIVDVKVNGSLDTNSIFVIRAALLADVGIAILPMYCIEPDLEAGTVEEILVDYPVPQRPIHALFPYSRYLPFRVRAFIDFLIDNLRD